MFFVLMKKFDLLLLLCLFCTAGYAYDRKCNASVKAGQSLNVIASPAQSGRVSRTSGSGDTTWYTNFTYPDTLTVFQVASGDSGYYTGTNVYGDKGFAERYSLNSADSTVAVIGVYALFAGTVNGASAHNATFKVWSMGDPITVAQQVSYSGFPVSISDSVMVPFTQLGIGPVADTQKSFYFPPPWVNTGSTFFVGFTLDYSFETLNGDTISLQCTKNGERNSPAYTVQVNISGTDTTTDTILQVQNATMYADGNWYDNYTQNDSIFNNLAVFPIVVIGNPNGVNSVSRNNLAFMGNMPNPADAYTDILVNLSQPDDVVVSVNDLNGRVVAVRDWKGLANGPHSLRFNTANLAPGAYIYTIRTANGAGIASKLEVVR